MVQKISSDDEEKAKKYYFSGVSFYEKNDFRNAILCFKQVLQIIPFHPESLNYTGLSLNSIGDYQNAINFFLSAVKYFPDKAEYYSNLGIAFENYEDLEKALKNYLKSYSINPENSFNNYLLGKLYYKISDFKKSSVYLEKAIKQEPENEELIHLLAMVYSQDDENYQKAEKLFFKAIELNPSVPYYYFHLGNLYDSDIRYKDAIEPYKKCLELRPQNSDYLNNLGVALYHNYEYEKSIELIKQAIKINPDKAHYYSNLGASLEDFGKIPEALEVYKKTLEMEPENAFYHCNYAGCLEESMNYSEAMKHYKIAYNLKSDDYSINYYYALIHMILGDLKTGWTKYKNFSHPKLRKLLQENIGDNEWEGQDINGKSIYVFCEQGFGDTIQFSRYLPEIKKRGGKLIFNCVPELLNLMKNNNWYDEIFSSPIEKIDFDFDYYVSVMWLPAIFKVTYEDMKPEIPYLKVSNEKNAFWKDKLKDIKNLKVGICWNPNPEHHTFRKRRLPFEFLSDILKIKNISFISLQKGHDENLISTSEFCNFFEFSNEIKDFEDTAAIIKNIDLVITVDTSIAHLAGSLGQKTFTLIPYAPDWRWGLNRDDCPWYPSMTVIRQDNYGDWGSVIKKLKEKLSVLY